MIINIYGNIHGFVLHVRLIKDAREFRLKRGGGYIGISIAYRPGELSWHKLG